MTNIFVEKAVIPAAGLGSRMLPITKSIPKEMLPAGRKPMIQHVVEEAVASCLTQICIVIRKGKEAIRDYFCLRYPHKKDHGIEELERLTASCEITFAYQEQPRGLGDALLQARDFVGGDPFVMMIPDQLMRANPPATSQLLKCTKSGSAICSSLLKIPKAEIPFFPGARGFRCEQISGSNEFLMGRIQTEEETVRLYRDLDHEVRGFGRTIYPPVIFDYLGEDFVNPQTGEVDLLKTFEQCVTEVEHRGVLLEGEPFDLGTFTGYYHYLPRLWETSD